jgi:hypothetical protein
MEGVDYKNVNSVMAKVSNTWWLTHSLCQFMLSCFVHKDNKDIFMNAADLPSRKTREIARKDKSDSLVEARAVAKVNCPVSYGDVKYQMKKGRVDGMASQIDRNKIANINEQIKMMRDQEEIFVSAYREDTYLGLMNGLPGLMKQQMDATAVDTEELDNDNNDSNK